MTKKILKASAGKCKEVRGKLTDHEIALIAEFFELYGSHAAARFARAAARRFAV